MMVYNSFLHHVVGAFIIMEVKAQKGFTVSLEGSISEYVIELVEANNRDGYAIHVLAIPRISFTPMWGMGRESTTWPIDLLIMKLAGRWAVKTSRGLVPIPEESWGIVEKEAERLLEEATA